MIPDDKKDALARYRIKQAEESIMTIELEHGKGVFYYYYEEYKI